MHGEERTEQATPKRRQEARERGQVPKSVEVNATISLLAILLALRSLGDYMVNVWQDLAVSHLQRAGQFVVSVNNLQLLAMDAGAGFAKLTLPVLAISLLGGVVANVVQSGMVLTTKPLVPDFSRLNPLAGVSRLFSQRSLMELVKSALKAVLIAYQIINFFRQRWEDIVGLITLDVYRLGPALAGFCWELLFNTAVTLAVIAVADYIYQRWTFEKSLRMTKQEVKEEYKRSEGDPLIRSRTRQRQREMARSRMMAQVPKATVVITNPTHLAIALRYAPGEMAAPQVIAKGQRLVAQRIKEVARRHNIPVMENKPLAQSLYHSCDIDETIPADLYRAVAEIIAFVFRQSGRTPQGTPQQ